MKNLKNKINSVFIAVILSAFVLMNFMPVIAFAQPSEKKVREMLKGLMTKEHIPGLAYAVVKNGKIEMMGTIGKAHLAFNNDVTKQTAFQLASCSKIYTALLLGKLFDQKLLEPGQKLGSLLDSIPDDWKNITIFQLAAHQSGIKIGDFSGAQTSENALKIALKMPMEYEPGTRSSYVSSDYWILQYVIEKVTGLKYYDALKKYVLDPNGLRHTFVNNPKIGGLSDFDIIPEQAQEYHWFKNDSTLRINQMWFDASGYTAGGIYSSIEDITTIATLFDTGNFISDQTKKLITNPLLLQNGKAGSFGLGLIVRDYEGHKIVEHSGGPALADFVRFHKEGYTFIVLTNNRGVYPYLAKSVATLYIKDLKMPEVPAGWE
jgi:CubicO group peptidase (beta-lactamase class C family)